MGLSADSIFIQALRENTELMQTISNRLYGTAIPLPDEEADNAPVPYVIVTFDGLSNVDKTKDDSYESDYDTVSISIECVARTLLGLHALTQMVRNAVLNYLRGNETTVYDYQFGAQSIQYDSLKPCYWQVLTYQCDVEKERT